MSHLVEQKLKKLHYFPPNFRVQPPHSILAAHPLLASVPKKAFRKEVSHTAWPLCKPVFHTPQHHLQASPTGPPLMHRLKLQCPGAAAPQDGASPPSMASVTENA